jgi:hypothetical protein
MHEIHRSPTDYESSAHDSTEKEKVGNTLAPVISTRAGVYEDPNALMQPEDTHMGEFGTKRDLVRRLDTRDDNQPLLGGSYPLPVLTFH